MSLYCSSHLRIHLKIIHLSAGVLSYESGHLFCPEDGSIFTRFFSRDKNEYLSITCMLSAVLLVTSSSLSFPFPSNPSPSPYLSPSYYLPPPTFPSLSWQEGVSVCYSTKSTTKCYILIFINSFGTAQVLQLGDCYHMGNLQVALPGFHS